MRIAGGRGLKHFRDFLTAVVARGQTDSGFARTTDQFLWFRSRDFLERAPSCLRKGVAIRLV